MLKFRATGRALITSYAAVAVAFSVATIAAQHYSLEIRGAARDITGNAAPSMAYVSTMRGTLRQLEVLVMAEVGRCVAGTCAPAPQRLDQLRRALHETWSSYRQLPTFPDEVNQWPEVEESLARLDDGLAVTAEALRSRDARAAAARLDEVVAPAFDRLDAAVAAVLEFDHVQGRHVAARIDELARTSLRSSIVLDLLAVGLTVLAAVLAIRFVHAHERTLREHADDLDQFAGRVAHDIMSPLATASAALWVARRHTEREGAVALDKAGSAVRRVERLVHGLLAFARAGASSARRDGVADAREVLDEVVAELQPAAAAAGVALRVDAAEPALVACSPGVLTSIVTNLARNAIAHMGASDVREVRMSSRRLAARRAVRVEVEDSGPGIPAALGERVFEPFVRGPGAAAPGVGLGLATAKRFVDAHGGRIGFEPAPRGGTLFWFELPAAEEARGGNLPTPSGEIHA